MGPSKAKDNSSANASISHGIQQIVFLLPEDSVPGEKMQLAYDAHKHSYPEASAVWKNGDLYSTEPIDTSHKVFVCDKFQGNAFDNLKKCKARIFGPQFILHCCENQIGISSKQNLIFSATMQGLHVSLTNLKADLRKDLQSKIQLMGGLLPKGFTKDVTHLVAGEVGSKKYHVACGSNRPVMLPDWIKECWEFAQDEIFHATDKRFDKFQCPIFKGITATVSQMELSERKEIQGLIENNGGTYSGDLKVGTTTHLIINEMTGKKFKVARKNQIFCVTASWVYNSFAKGFCMDEILYPVEGSGTDAPCSSTPTKSDATTLKDLSCASTILSASVRTVNDTAITNASMVNPDKSNSENTLNRQSVLQDQMLLRKLELCKQTSGLFLDGCKIMISGFSPAVTEKLRKILNNGGATRFNQLNDNVSHVILGDKMDENYKSLLEGQYRPHIVNINWLIESINSGKPADEADFLCSQMQTTANVVSPFSKSKIKAGDLTNEPSYSTVTAGGSINADEMDDEVMSQYVSGFQDDVKVFHGFSFMVLGFEDENVVDDFKSVITANGGILETCSDSAVDFVVVPINGHANKVCAQANVTDFWMQSCIEEGSIQEVSSHPLFSPISIDLTREPLSGCVFSISQYSGYERDCLVQIIHLLGGRFQEYLSRQTSATRQLLASTHLIAKNPEGSKYIGSLNWGLPVVNFEWLLACAEANEKVNEAPFVIGNATGNKNNAINELHKQSSAIHDAGNNSHIEQQLNKLNENRTPLKLNPSKEGKSKPPAEEQSTPILSKSYFKTPNSGLRNSVTSERILQIKERIKNRYQTPIQANRIKKLIVNQDSSLHSSCDSPGLNTPGKFLDPNMDFMPKFDIRDAMASLESPLKESTTVNSRRSLNLPLEDVYIAKVNQALRYEIETTGGIVPNRSMDDLIEDTSKTTILSDVVIVVSKKLMHMQSELNKVTEQMGGRYRWKYDKACTHFVHQGKASEYNRELRVAQDDGKSIVSPEWLFACQQKQVRIAEHLYPYTFNRQLVLDVSTHTEFSPSGSRNNVTPTPNLNHSTLKKTPQLIISDPKNLSDSNFEMKSKIMETANKQMDVLFAAKGQKDKRTTRPTHLSASNSSAENRSASDIVRSHGILRKNSADLAVDPWIEPLDTAPITWDDPTSRLERERLAVHLSKDSESFSQARDLDSQFEPTTFLQREDLEKCGRETTVSKTTELGDPLAMRFLLAGLKTQERQKISEGIQKIGGCLIDSSHFDPSCTHLIIGLLNRTEKCLSAIASGRWVLKPSYIYECERAGQILKAEDYEWFSEIQSLSDEQKTFAKAAHYWRTKLKNLKSTLPVREHKKIGAFSDWKVILYTNSQREENFRRLLEAGAAEIVSTNPPFSNVKGVTHAILEFSKIQSPNIDMSSLVSAGVHCIKPDFIAQFLLEESSDIRSYYVTEALPFYEYLEADSMKRKSDETDGCNKKTRQQ